MTVGIQYFPVLSLRFRAYLIDLMILGFLVYFDAFLVSFLGDVSSMMKGLVFVLVLVLFEPLMITLTGGTLGHHYAGLKIADAKKQGNLGFLKAIIRVVLKFSCGFLSFFGMLINRKHRAIHDVFSGSVVLFKNDKAAPKWRQLKPREELLAGEKASLARRLLVFVAYSAIAYFIITWLLSIFVSNSCLAGNYCQGVDGVWLIGLYGLMILLCVIFFIKAIRSTLYGTNFK